MSRWKSRPVLNAQKRAAIRSDLEYSRIVALVLAAGVFLIIDAYPASPRSRNTADVVMGENYSCQTG